METGFDLGPIYVTVDIDYKVWQGEKMVMYYADGSGYPGSPPELEILGVVVTSVSGETYDKSRTELSNGGWDGILDQLATEYVEKDVSEGNWISQTLSEEE